MATQTTAASKIIAATSSRFTVTRSSPSLWRVTFHNPPINLIDPVMIVALHHLLTEIERDSQVAVVVFDSADPDFFLAHYDVVADASAFDALPAVPTAFHHWAHFLIRLGKCPAVTITAVRGRARGAGSEFVLATDIRFASRERAVLGQFEVGFAAVPGGGPSTRLPGIVGRGRRSRSCSVARILTENSPSATATSTALFLTQSSSSSSIGLRSGSPGSICSRWPTSSASSTQRRCPPTKHWRTRWMPSDRPPLARLRAPSWSRRSSRASSSAATLN